MHNLYYEVTMRCKDCSETWVDTYGYNITHCQNCGSYDIEEVKTEEDEEIGAIVDTLLEEMS